MEKKSDAEADKQLKNNRKEKKEDLVKRQKKLKKELRKIRASFLAQQLDVMSLNLEQKRNLVQNAQKLSADRFLKDNERIWTVTTIFLPLSLAGLSQLKDKPLSVVFLLGFGSVCLITFWYITTEKLRKFQDDNLDAVNIYDLYLGIDTDALSYRDESIKNEENQIKQEFDELDKFPWYMEEGIHERLADNCWIKTLRSIPIQRARLYMYCLVTISWMGAVLNAIRLEYSAEWSKPLVSLWIVLSIDLNKLLNFITGNKLY